MGNIDSITCHDTQFHEQYLEYLGLSENEKADVNVKNVTFVVTHDCTLRCSYCYECHKNKETKMSFETAKKIIDMMFEDDMGEHKFFDEKKATALILEFIGGEPLLEINLIDQIMEYFLTKAVELNHRWQTEYMISMISNGTQYFTKSVQEFIKKYKGRLCLSISIDGTKEVHDSCRLFPDGSPSFNIAQKAYKDALNKNLTGATKLTIAPDNLKYLAKGLKELSLYKGTRSIPGNAIFEEEWTTEQAREFYYQLKEYGQWNLNNGIYKSIAVTLFQNDYLGVPFDKHHDSNYCGGTGKMLAFDCDGKIYPCLRYIPFALQNKDKREAMILGDSENGFLYNKDQCNRMKCLDCITLTSQSSEKCINCPIQGGCAWCSGWNYDYYGTPNKRFTGICNMHKARVLANVWYWNTLYRKEDIDERFPMNVPKEWALEIIDEEEYNILIELAKK